MIAKWVIPVISAALGSMSFAMFFGMKSRKLIWCTLGGALTWATYLAGLELGLMDALSFMMASAAGTLFAEILARIVKTPVTMFAITSVIPLVPGGSLYYTMLGLFNGEHNVFVEKGIHTLAVAGSMAMGMFAATMVFRVVYVTIRFIFCGKKRRARGR